MPELRIDPVVGRKVLVAEDRAGRPFDFAAERHTRSVDPPCGAAKCCFCNDHEAETPPAVSEKVDRDGKWNVRVVPNKYPALSLAAPVDSAFGAHEVIVESPDHVLDWLDLSVDQVANVLTVYRDRMKHWAADGRMRHALVFKNSGFAAGASLEHVHSQLISTPNVADVVQAELDACRAFHQQTGRPLFADLLEREIRSGERLVGQVDGYVALCAYAGRQPYETWFFPEQSAARFETIADDQLRPLAALLRMVLGGLRSCLPQLSYNLVLHSGPFDGEFDDSYHWHWELLPRTSQLAGIELGGGFFINTVSPERAAAKLRKSLAQRASAAQSGNSVRSAAL